MGQSQVFGCAETLGGRHGFAIVGNLFVQSHSALRVNRVCLFELVPARCPRVQLCAGNKSVCGAALLLDSSNIQLEIVWDTHVHVVVRRHTQYYFGTKLLWCSVASTPDEDSAPSTTRALN